MEQNGTWGDHVILYGAANCYKTHIRVISSQSNIPDITVSPGGHVISANPLVLGHVHEVHYVSLQPKQGEASRNTPCYKTVCWCFFLKSYKVKISASASASASDNYKINNNVNTTTINNYDTVLNESKIYGPTNVLKESKNVLIIDQV